MGSQVPSRQIKKIDKWWVLMKSEKSYFVSMAGMVIVLISTLLILFSGGIPASGLFQLIYQRLNTALFYLLLNLLLLSLLKAWWGENWPPCLLSLAIINITGITYSTLMDISLTKGTIESLWSAILPAGIINIIPEPLKHKRTPKEGMKK